MKIFGLTGLNASGKGEAANYLKERSFYYFSLSDILREQAKKEGLKESRHNLIRIGNDLRNEHGPDVLARMTREKIERLGKDCVVDSIRNPNEVLELRKLKDFKLICISAPIEVRFKRAKMRGRLENADTLEEFKKNEDMENSDDPKSQQLDETIRMADIVIENDGDLEALHHKLDKIL